MKVVIIKDNTGTSPRIVKVTGPVSEERALEIVGEHYMFETSTELFDSSRGYTTIPFGKSAVIIDLTPDVEE